VYAPWDSFPAFAAALARGTPRLLIHGE